MFIKYIYFISSMLLQCHYIIQVTSSVACNTVILPSINILSQDPSGLHLLPGSKGLCFCYSIVSLLGKNYCFTNLLIIFKTTAKLSSLKQSFLLFLTILRVRNLDRAQQR